MEQKNKNSTNSVRQHWLIMFEGISIIYIGLTYVSLLNPSFVIMPLYLSYHWGGGFLWFLSLVLVTLIIYIGLLDFQTFRKQSLFIKSLLIGIALIMTFISLSQFSEEFFVTDKAQTKLITPAGASTTGLAIFKDSSMGATAIVVYKCDFYIICRFLFSDGYYFQYDDDGVGEFLRKLSSADEISTLWRSEGSTFDIVADGESIRCYYLDGEVCVWDQFE